MPHKTRKGRRKGNRTELQGQMEEQGLRSTESQVAAKPASSTEGMNAELASVDLAQSQTSGGERMEQTVVRQEQKWRSITGHVESSTTASGEHDSEAAASRAISPQLRAPLKEFKELKLHRLAEDDGIGPCELYVQLKEMLTKWLQPEKNIVQQILDLLILERFMKLVSPDMAVWIKERDPKTAEEVTSLAESYISARKGAGGSSFSQRTQEPKTEALPLSTAEELPLSTAEALPLSTAEELPLSTAEALPLPVQESNSSSVKPVGASSNLEDDLEKSKLSGQFNNVYHLKTDYEEESVDPYGRSSDILRGQMDDTRMLIERRPKSEITSSHSEAKILRDLKHPGIAGVKWYHEDEKFTYLILDFDGSPLEEHIRQITSHQTIENEKKTTAYLINLTFKALEGLNFLHQQNYLHGDIKHQNVRVDKEGQPKWINFSSASPTEKDDDGSKMKDEIKRAGEFAYFILSGGENYCKLKPEWNFSELQWDFIEWMTEKGKNLNEVLDHPMSWRKYRKLKYLEALGNLNNKVTKKLRQTRRRVRFKNWKSELIKPELLKKMEQDRAKRGAEGEVRPYSEDVLGLLRFIRNFLQHRPEEEIEFLVPFPGLFESVYILARDMGWNSRPSVERIFSGW